MPRYDDFHQQRPFKGQNSENLAGGFWEKQTLSRQLVCHRCSEALSFAMEDHLATIQIVLA